MSQKFNYMGRWYTLEQYQKLLNPEVSTPKEVETPNITEQSLTAEPLSEQKTQEAINDVPEKKVQEVPAPKPIKKSKKSNNK